MKTFTQQLQNDFIIDPQDAVVDSLVGQYERVIVDSIITSFGLDFLLFHDADQHGGDVDTIHNVRQIGKDPKMGYKSKVNEQAYRAETPYSKKVKAQYDSDQAFIKVNAEVSRKRADGSLIDAYTGEGIARNQRVDLDHVIATKEIHEDRGRILSGLSGIDLANSEENLRPTDMSINRSMKEKSIAEYLAWIKENEPYRQARIAELEGKSSLSPKEESELHKLQQQEAIMPEAMLKSDSIARKSYEAKLRTAYYTSPQFFKDTAKAAGKVGALMGARQLFGFIFMEIWISVREELNKASSQDNFDIEKALRAIGNGIKQGAVNAKAKYKDLIAQLGEGMVAGALGSITTTLCNIFFTTAKNTIRIIRQAWASLTGATSILLFNPDNLLFGERFRAAAKVISAGASLVVGRTVEAAISEAIVKTPLISIPVVCEVIPTFCGVFLTGIMSCTLLYYLDQSELLNKAIRKLNELPTIELSIMEFKQQAIFFKQYAAELMQIDIDRFEKEVNTFTSLAKQLDGAENEADLNSILKGAYKQLGIMLPWQGDFDTFMQGGDHLVFE